MKQIEKLSMALLSLFVSALSLAQVTKVSGTVTSAGDNSPLPGVNILVKGNAIGTITDKNGDFLISVAGDHAVLIFSFIGFDTQEIAVGNKLVLNIKLVPTLLELEEIVITSLGIKREKRALTFSAQDVGTEEIARVNDLNVINSLSGNVAGLDIIRANSGVGSPTRVVIRGNRSIIGNNQPLYIVDGVPINNTGSGPNAEVGGIAFGDGIGNINPEDIESITVLKGPSAAALYGNRANNGAIVITTKKGTARKGVGVEYSLNYSIETPVILTRLQDVYGQGSAGIYLKNNESDWGPKMEGQAVEHWTPDNNSPKYGTTYPFVAHPDNYKNFFQMGTNLTHSITVTSGTENVLTYFSYTNTQSRGIVPNNELTRHNVNLRITSKLSKRLSMDSKVTYFHQDVKNRVSTGDDFTNPMRAILQQPSNISQEEAQNYEYFDNSGFRRQNFWNPHTEGGGNPWWIVNRIPFTEERDRVLGMASVKYKLFDDLNLQIRSAIDYYGDINNQDLYNDTYHVADRGNFIANKSYNYELNNDFLLSYNKTVAGDFSFSVSAGGNMLTQKWLNSGTNNGFLLKPNLFTYGNAGNLTAYENGATKKLNSLYGFASLGFKNCLFLDLTARNDWSSTLPPASWSYFYLSAGLACVVSDMLKSLPRWFTFAKIRGSYAQVGNDTDPYRLDPTFNFYPGGANGYASRDATRPSPDLKPELTTSKELGLDIRFLHNRLGFDFTWYKSNSINQFLNISLPVASGYDNKFVNAGNIQNTGFEVTMNLRPVAGKLKWDMEINFATNKSRVLELSEGFTEYTIRGSSYMTIVKVIKGNEYGDIFTRGFERNKDGRILIGSDGLPITTDGLTQLVGNYNPDWIGGIKNSFSFKGFDLSFIIDIRMGGDVISYTEANLASGGFSDNTLNGREGFIVGGIMQIKDDKGNIVSETENIKTVNAEKYWQSVGGRFNGIGELFKFDASNIRVREALLGYTKSVNSHILNNISVSLFGRNLFFIMNKAKRLDPNLMLGTSNSQGIEAFGLPGTRTIGMYIKVSF